MKKILFPTDFSQTSLNAYMYALRLAKNLDAEVVTLHVFDYPMEHLVENNDYFLLDIYNIKEWGDFENFKSEVPRLRAIAEKAELGRVKVSHMLERGDTVTEILKTISNERPDIVVIGTKGATGLKEVFLGSVAERIMNQAKTMVLAIPAECRYKPIKKILYLTQFEKLQMDLLHKLHNFAVRFKAHILALQLRDFEQTSDKLLLSKWKDHFGGNNITFEIQVTDSVEETITETLGARGIDLIALHVHHKGLLEKLLLHSLPRELAFHSQVPLLTIPL